LQTSSSLRTLPRIAALVAMAEYLYRGEPLDAAALLEQCALDQVLDHHWYHPEMPPVRVLHRLVELYGFFQNDPNVLKLLEFAEGFETMPEFLEEFARSRIPVASHTLKGARILTVHGSKGLEFGYVIVLDRSGREQGDHDPLIPRYGEDLYIERFFYRMRGREQVDEEYAQLLEERKAAAEKDRLNLLYVALTRAVEGMIILRKPKGSVFERLPMAPGSTGTVEPEPLQVSPELPASVEKVSLSAYGRQELPEEDPQDEGPDHRAILLGTALHYALEMMDRFTSEAAMEAMEALRNRYGALLYEEELEEIARRLDMLCTYEPFLTLTRDARLLREQPLIYRGKMRQVDLILDRQDSRVLIDYKSSRKHQHKHQEQVREYCRAFESFDSLPVRGALLYLTETEVALEWVQR